MVDKSSGGSVSPKSCPRAHMSRCVEKDAEEKIGAWRHVDHLLMPGFLLAHLVVGSSTGDGVVAGQVRRKNFWQVKYSNGVRGFRSYL